MNQNFYEVECALHKEVVIDAVNEFITPQNLAALGLEFFPGKKHRYVHYLIETISEKGRLELYSPCCADQISGNGSIADLGTGPGQKNMQYLEIFPAVCEFFMNRGIPVYYAMLYSDIDSDASFRLEKLGISREEYVSRMTISSEEMYREFSGLLEENGVCDSPNFAGFNTFLMGRDGLYTDENLRQVIGEVMQIAEGKVRGVVLDRNETFKKWIKVGTLSPSEYDQVMMDIAKIYLIETITLGKGISGRKGVLLNLDAPIMAPYYRVPVLRIPKVKS